MNDREASAAILIDLARALDDVNRKIEAHWDGNTFIGDDDDLNYLYSVKFQILRDMERHTDPTPVAERVAGLVRRARQCNHGFLAARSLRNVPRANTYRACRDQLIQDARALRQEAHA